MKGDELPQDDGMLYRIAVRHEDGLLKFDGLLYRGLRCAERNRRTIERMTGRKAELRAVAS